MVLSRLVSFTSKNVFTNLAAEERLFSRTTGPSLLFYVNNTCAVIGRTQNPFNEVDISYAASERVPVVRRRSGGGTVVHDDGNLNLCFVSDRSVHDPCANAKLLSSVLREEFGVPASVNKRGDILVDELKVSGSAYRISRDRAYHHATLLVNSDLPRLRRLLQSPLKSAIAARGSASVPSSVANLVDCGDGHIDIPSLIQAISDRWQRRAKARVQCLSAASVEREVGGVQEERASLYNHAWVYGQAPRFSYNLQADAANVTLFMSKGARVERVELSSSDTDPSTEQALNELLVGTPFGGDSLIQALQKGHDSVDLSNNNIVQACSTVFETLPYQYWTDDDVEEKPTYPSN